MKLLAALNWRYAVKRFSDEKLATTDVKALLDMTRLSASSYGLQPYTILVVESPEVRQALLPYSYGQDKVYHSSHLIVFAAQTAIGDVTVERYIDKLAAVANKSHEDLNPYATHMKQSLAGMAPEQKQEWAHQQAYIALGNLLTCAAMMQIDSCPMTGFEREGYDAVLKLEEKGLTTTVICPIGHRHPEDLQAFSPKVRFDYHEIVMEV